jgi:predicted transcriptional regulator
MSEQMAQQLRKLVNDSGKSILSIAKECGVTQSRLFYFMEGKDIRLQTAQKLADYFGLVLVPDERPTKKKPG